MPAPRTDVCKTCQAPKDGHRHCGDCKARMVKGKYTKHEPMCRALRKDLAPGQSCPICHKLLASGAPCPVHGNPMTHGVANG